MVLERCRKNIRFGTVYRHIQARNSDVRKRWLSIPLSAGESIVQHEEKSQNLFCKRFGNRNAGDPGEIPWFLEERDDHKSGQEGILAGLSFRHGNHQTGPERLDQGDPTGQQ